MEQGGEEWRVVLVFQVANKYIFPGKTGRECYPNANSVVSLPKHTSGREGV